MKYITLFILTFILLTACQQDRIIISEIPEIELLNVAPLQVQAQKDSVVFEVKYTDGDGDLGTNDDTQRNVFVTDKRINVTQAFRVQQLAPDGADIAITGTFNLILPNTLLTMGAGQESVSFSLYVMDRAGNKSNEVDSPEIIVIP